MTGPNVTYACQACGYPVVEGIPHHCAGTPAPAAAAIARPLNPHMITPAEAAESGVVSHAREPGFGCWWDGVDYHDTPRRAYEAWRARGPAK